MNPGTATSAAPGAVGARAHPARVEAQRGHLLERLADLESSLDERLDQLANNQGLTRRGPSLERPIRLGIPRPLLDFVATAMAELEALGREDLTGLLTMLYGETMPLTLATQLAGLDPRCPWLMDEPLLLERMPRLRGALERLSSALAHGLSTLQEPHEPRGRPRPQPLWQRGFEGPLRLGELYPTTFFGRLQPLFGTTPTVLAELAATPQKLRPEAIDRLLGPAILHELLHFTEDRAPLWPPYLDEAIAGGLGVHLLPETAFPAPDQEALEGFLTFAQVGLALIDRLGLDSVLLAQAGLVDWDTLIPNLRQRALDLYWPRFLAAPAAHLHPDWDDPRPWAELFDPAAPSPGAVLARAARCLNGASMARSRTHEGRVVQAPPPPCTFDFARGLMTPASGATPNPGAPKVQLLHRLRNGPRFELAAGATLEDLRAALDAAPHFDPW